MSNDVVRKYKLLQQCLHRVLLIELTERPDDNARVVAVTPHERFGRLRAVHLVVLILSPYNGHARKSVL